MGTRKNRQSLRRSKKGGGGRRTGRKMSRQLTDLKIQGQGMLRSLMEPPAPPSSSGTSYGVRGKKMISSSEPDWCQRPFPAIDAYCSQCPSLHSTPGSACFRPRRHGGGKSRKRNKRKSQRRNKKQRKN